MKKIAVLVLILALAIHDYELANLMVGLLFFLWIFEEEDGCD